MWAILMWKMENYMDRNWWIQFATALPGIELDPAGLNWMAGPLFPSFTGSVPLTLDGMLLGIESDSQALSPWDGVEKCWKQSLLPMYSNRPSWLVGIQWAFKWTQGTFIFELHWVSSAIQFDSCTCLRTQFTRLRTELTVEAVRDFIALEKCQTQGISGSVVMCRHGKMSDPGHWIRSGQLPGTILQWKNVGPMSNPGNWIIELWVLINTQSHTRELCLIFVPMSFNQYYGTIILC